jgi:hypothetical protein
MTASRPLPKPRRARPTGGRTPREQPTSGRCPALASLLMGLSRNAPPCSPSAPGVACGETNATVASASGHQATGSTSPGGRRSCSGAVRRPPARRWVRAWIPPPLRLPPALGPAPLLTPGTPPSGTGSRPAPAQGSWLSQAESAPTARHRPDRWRAHCHRKALTTRPGRGRQRRATPLSSCQWLATPTEIEAASRRRGGGRHDRSAHTDAAWVPPTGDHGAGRRAGRGSLAPTASSPIPPCRLGPRAYRRWSSR